METAQSVIELIRTNHTPNAATHTTMSINARLSAIFACSTRTLSMSSVKAFTTGGRLEAKVRTIVSLSLLIVLLTTSALLLTFSIFELTFEIIDSSFPRLWSRKTFIAASVESCSRFNFVKFSCDVAKACRNRLFS